MPLGTQRQCAMCGTISTPIWARNDGNEVVCHSCCYGRPKEDDSSQNSNGDSNGSSVDVADNSGKVTIADKNTTVQTPSTSEPVRSSSVIKDNGSSLKKNVKNRQVKTRNAGTNKSVANKGKGRRNIFKKSVHIL